MNKPMPNHAFRHILNRRLMLICETLDKKSAEYSANDNRLHNFDKAAEMNNCSPAIALWGFLTKHLVSVQDMALGNHKASLSMIDDKIGDAINYLILLEAVLHREIDEQDCATGNSRDRRELDGEKPTE